MYSNHLYSRLLSQLYSSPYSDSLFLVSLIVRTRSDDGNPERESAVFGGREREREREREGEREREREREREKEREREREIKG